MFIDALNRFSDEEEHIASGFSTGEIDFCAARDIGTGENLYLVAVVSEAMVGAGTVTVAIETDSDEAFGSPTEAQVIGTFAAGSLAGEKLEARLAPGKIDEQFVRLKYTLSAGNTAGKFTSFITNTIDKTKDYPIGYTIS